MDACNQALFRNIRISNVSQVGVESPLLPVSVHKKAAATHPYCSREVTFYSRFHNCNTSLNLILPEDESYGGVCFGELFPWLYFTGRDVRRRNSG